MNSLNGEVRYAFDRIPEPPRPYHVDVSRIRCFADGDLPSVFHESSQVFCAMVGYLSNGADLAARYDIQAKTDVEIVAALFSLGGLGRIGQLDGMFTLFLADESSQRAFLLQDELAGCLPLYYTSTSNAFIFGTQLKHVLAKMGSARTLNLQACYDALFNGHIYQANVVSNRSTLVQGVYKLTPGSVLEVGLAEPGYRI